MSHPSTTWPLLEETAPSTPSSTGAHTFTPGVDFLLTTDGDLDITEADGLRFTTGVTAIAQGVRRRLQMFLGEWFLDESLGVDYWGSALGQKFVETRVLQAFRPVLLASPGVVSIDKLAASFDGATRLLSVSWEVMTDLGKLADDIEVQG